MAEEGREVAGLVDPAEVAATQKAVKQLLFGEGEEKAAAVAEIKRLAAGDGRRKRLLAKLGVIPPLVSMLDDDRRRWLVVGALVELADGAFENKVLMVEAGLLLKLPKIKDDTQDLSKNKELLSLLCSISSLAKTPFSFDPSHMLPSLTQILLKSKHSTSADEITSRCISAIFNLSIKLENIHPIVSNGIPSILLALSHQIKGTSEGALAILGNLMLSEIGKRSVEELPAVPEALMEIMAWEDKPKSQELAAYLLMVVAHRSQFQRDKMAGLGIVPLLLQVALLGSSLAQERALKMLQWFKIDARTRRRGHSAGPQGERHCSSLGEREVRESRRAVERMVKLSLDRNMEAIVRRANVSEDLCSFKSLLGTSSSKSLPY